MGSSTMKLFLLTLFALFSIISTRLTGGLREGRGKAVRRGEQDETVLRNAYHQMRGWNNDIQVDKRMEELAQSHGCVGRHEVHNNSWQDREILQTYNNVGAIIACAGSQGCPNNRKFREKPAEIWYEFRNKTPHFRATIDNNRMGCAATKKGNNVCLFCYLAR